MPLHTDDASNIGRCTPVTESRSTGMPHSAANPESAYRDQWLALLEKNGVRRPTDLAVIAVPGIVVQLTRGEPSGSLELEESPGSVLMVNLSPVQALRQERNQRSFVNNMLNWDMTLMPRGTRSKWSWNSTCDRFDVILSPDVLGDEHPMETVDRFLFRDAKLKNLCQRLCREIILRDRADRLLIEMLAIELAEVFLHDYSTAPEHTRGIPTGGLTRNNAKRVLEYAEANLGRALTLRELAGVAQLSVHHFVRMFRKTLGVTPHQYLLERRVERAKDLLRDKRAGLAEVALSSGFGSQSHFTSAFHRAVGATPSEFQRLFGKPI